MEECLGKSKNLNKIKNASLIRLLKASWHIIFLGQGHGPRSGSPHRAGLQVGSRVPQTGKIRLG